MRFRRGFLTLGCFVLLCGMMTGQTSAQVRVLVYKNVDIPGPAMHRARNEATRIFHTAGIELSWIDCSSGLRRTECRPSSSNNVLLLHIVAGIKPTGDMVYGQAFLGEDGTGNLADLYFDRVKDAQRDFGINPGRLLGAVAAHELGHLLLGSHAHSWLGIMTPIWTGENLRLVSMGDAYFTQQQATRIREHLQDRSIGRRENWKPVLHRELENRTVVHRTVRATPREIPHARGRLQPSQLVPRPAFP